MTAEEIENMMNEEASHSARNIGLLKNDEALFPNYESCLSNLPEPALWDQNELEELTAAVSDPNSPAYKPRKRDQSEWKDWLVKEFRYTPEEADAHIAKQNAEREAEKAAVDPTLGVLPTEKMKDTPVDLTDPLAHIRNMIRKDFPEADLASDDELMVLYDRWEAIQPEQDDDTGGTQDTV